MFFLLPIYDFLQSVEVVVLEYVGLKVIERLRTERTAVMPAYRLLDTAPTVHMPTAGDVAVIDGVGADGALKLVLQQFGGDFEGVVEGLLCNHGKIDITLV